MPAAQAADPAEVAAIQEAVETTMEANNVRAAIVRVMRGDEVVLMQAWGESMAEVPATTDMHFRSGAVSIPMVSTVLLQLVDEGTVALDDKLAEWLPDVPNADKVTLGQLAQMTSGYADYVQDATFLDGLQPSTRCASGRRRSSTRSARASRSSTSQAPTGTTRTRTTCCSRLALEKITGQSMIEAIQERIFDPLGMAQTADPGTPEILQPVLHAFDSERREYLQIAAGLPYIEDATYWNPSWSLGPGSIQNTDIADMATVIQAIGRGEIGQPGVVREDDRADAARQDDQAGRVPDTCFVQNEFYTYGLGIVLSGDWLLQNPQYHGFAGVAAYLPADDITIAIAATYDDDAFNPDTGVAIVSNLANPLFTAVATVVAPDASTPPGT